MSIRMAIAKLSACVCGGAVVGGGAIHYAEHPHPRAVYRAIVAHRAAAISVARRTVTSTTACAPGAVVIAAQNSI